MGGTFGCIGEPLSPMPEIDFKPQLKRILPQHVHIDFFTAHTIKDSSACTASDWLQLIQQIQDLKTQEYQHFIIIHGTDTLSYAAATLSQFLQHSTHVIFTASQYPLLNVEGNDLRTFTDALENLIQQLRVSFTSILAYMSLFTIRLCMQAPCRKSIPPNLMLFQV